MSAARPSQSISERVTDHVMDQLYAIVRRAVEREVGEELADQRAQLAEDRASVDRQKRAKLQPRLPSHSLVKAAAEVAEVSLALEDAKFTPGERNAREKLEKTITQLRTEYRRYAADQRRKGIVK